VKLHKTEIAKREIETAIDLFLSDKDPVSALGLAGAAEDILGGLLRRNGEKSMLENLHDWYQDTTGTNISFGDFATNANLARNTLKHANAPGEDEVEIFRWETVQMLMRALYNWKALGHPPSEQMLEFNRWLKEHKDSYASLK
jgi:hypothetical protein